MKMTVTAIVMVLATVPGLSQSNNCLRVMTPEELSQKASFIARVKVSRTEKVGYFGMYSQLATAATADVIDGDDRLTQISILARSNVQCADDEYTPKQDLLVFLAQEGSVFRTLDFQYGEFLIVGDVVKNWRGKDNKAADKPYADVRKEIEAYVVAARTPPPPPPQPTPQPTPPPANNPKGQKPPRPPQQPG
ncbi:MAG TPA: hypothetical protein VI756_00515 [Blastocatellia bacterium]